MSFLTVIIICALIWIPAYFYAEHKQRELEEEERRKAQKAAEAARRLKEWAKEEERRAKERRKEAERRAKEEAKAAQRAAEEVRKAAERAERAEHNKPHIEDLTRVLEAKTNLALALENAASKEADPVKKATMHERAARTYAQAHIISEKIDKLIEGKL